MTPLIDADVLRYEVGAICEGEDGPASFDYVEQVLVKKILDICDWANATTEPILFLTGKKNFRNDVAVSKPYKGTRQSTKPWHWHNITAYMWNQYDVRLVEGLEADDLMTIEQCSRDDTVICTRDKDLRMVPGWHYGWECGAQREFGPLLVTEAGAIHLNTEGKTPKLTGTGMAFFFSQLLTGDNVDNIPGLPRVGPVKAYEILTEDPARDMWEAVQEAYIDKGYDGEYLYEQIDLLWMVRRLHDDGSPVLWRPS